MRFKKTKPKGRVRIDIKEVFDNPPAPYSIRFGKAKCMTVYETSTEEVFDLIAKALKKASQ